MSLVRSFFLGRMLLPLLVAAPAQAGGGGQERVPDSILVRFKTQTAARISAAQRGHRVASTKDHGSLVKGLQTWQLPKGSSVDAALAALKADPDVLYAEPNYVWRTTAIPNDPSFGQLWGMHNTGQTAGTADADIDAPEAWDLGTGTGDVVVGVVDTGIDYNHPDLTANMWRNPGEIAGNGIDDDANGVIDDVYGFNAITGTGNPFDDNNHGSHCAGTIGGRGNNGVGVAGVAWNVQLMAIKFLSAAGSGSTQGAIDGINYAVTMKNRGVNIRVLSNSWGGGAFSQALLDAINAANAAGILFVAAAGNSSANNDLTPHYPSSYDAPNVLAVAATDHNDALATFSSYGATSVDLGAPGVNVLSTTPNNTYSTFSGTSMATPHVSGAAALLAMFNPTLTVAQLKSTLMSTVDPIPALNGRTVTGGRLNVFQAASAVGTTPTFSLSVTPGAATITQGQTATFTVTVTPFGGFAGNVNLSLSSSPALAGATTSFTPNPVAAGGTSTLSVATTTGTAAASYSLTITGVSGTITRTSTVTLVVDPEGTVTVSYSNPTVISIPDNNVTGIESTISVPDALSILSTTVRVDITHTYIGDLEVSVVSPQGTTHILHNRTGGSTDNLHQSYTVTTFNGQNSQGTWRLKVRDLASIDLGTLDNWTLTIKGAPTAPPPPDTTPPSVSITSPAAGSTVSGQVAVTAAASDNVGVTEVRFFVDGSLAATDTTSPYSFTWNTTQVANGLHTLDAQASDAAGNVTNAVPVSVTVSNDVTPPVISGVASSGITASSATITWQTNEPSTTQVEYGTTTAYGSMTSLDPALVTSHSATLTGLAAGTLYHYRVRSADAAGNLAISGDFIFTTAAPSDSVSISRAQWTASKSELSVEGTVTSSTATLTATFGTRTEPVTNGNGRFRARFTGVTSNPGTVTVTSSGGGSDTAVVAAR